MSGKRRTDSGGRLAGPVRPAPPRWYQITGTVVATLFVSTYVLGLAYGVYWIQVMSRNE